MDILKQRICQEGKTFPGNIVKVDGFLNHQVDTQFLCCLADEFAARLDVSRATKILTAEASGIALATVCSLKYGIPMIYAKKAKSGNLGNELYCSEITSYTYQKTVTLICSREWLRPNDRVLIVDDFMARGESMRGLIDIVRQAGAQLVGIGVAVEKGFQGGGDSLRSEGYPLESLAIIDKADENGFVFRGD